VHLVLLSILKPTPLGHEPVSISLITSSTPKTYQWRRPEWSHPPPRNVTWLNAKLLQQFYEQGWTSLRATGFQLARSDFTPLQWLMYRQVRDEAGNGAAD